MHKNLARAALAGLLMFGVASAVEAKDPWKEYNKAEEKRAKEYYKFQRKQAHEWHKYQRKQAKDWENFERRYYRYEW